ncbi:MAG: hypothetical protein AB7O24_08995 [Kofleriaceae bacterium]
MPSPQNTVKTSSLARFGGFGRGKPWQSRDISSGTNRDISRSHGRWAEMAAGVVPLLSSRSHSFAVASAIALAVMVGTQAMSCQGGYSINAAYRAQTDAFLHGRLALSEAPEALAHDLAWTDTGVQQVWGLGVPIWQLPFEAFSRLIGLSPFPDRVAMLAWFVIVWFVLIRAFRPRESEPPWSALGTLIILGLLPALLTMLRGRIAVYEEAAAYAYGGAIILLGGLVWFARAPTRTRYLLLLAIAGLAGFLRPTAWFYGLATAAVATAIYVLEHRRRGLPSIAIGVALFVAGGGLLYASNARRFGAGTEFGHSLNLHALPGNVMATRFSYPFERVGTREASIELIGSLFDRPEQRADVGYYQPDLHRGQSDTVRWREYYFTTYTWLYAVPLLAGIMLGALAWWRRSSSDPLARWLIAWAVLGSAPLFVFYLHSPSVSSRYQLDFGPAFAVLIVIGWRAVATWSAARGRAVLALCVLCTLWVSALATGATRRRTVRDSVSHGIAILTTEQITAPVGHALELPRSYDLTNPQLRSWIEGPTISYATNRRAQARLYLNGIGWDLGSGRIAPASHFFVEDPQFVELDVESASGAALDWPRMVRVKVGLHELHVARTEPLARGVRLRFESPEPLPPGLQVAFVAFGPDEELDRVGSQLLLRRVGWH